MMTVLQTTWQKAVVVRIRARQVFVLGAVLANLSLVALPRALALDPDRRISQYGHTVWRIQDGAISPPTNIAQTTDGFLWVTTAQGLMRFDGVRFLPWQPPQRQNLPGTHFSAVFGSRDGSLWIGTTRGLARWSLWSLDGICGHNAVAQGFRFTPRLAIRLRSVGGCKMQLSGRRIIPLA